MKIKYNIERLNPEVKFPKLNPNKYKIYLYAPEDINIEPNKYEIVRLGFKINMQKDCVLIIHPRIDCNVDEDGVEWNDQTLVEPGNDELVIIVYNLSDAPYHINKNDVIADASVCKKVNNAVWNVEDEVMEVTGGE